MQIGHNLRFLTCSTVLPESTFSNAMNKCTEGRQNCKVALLCLFLPSLLRSPLLAFPLVFFPSLFRLSVRPSFRPSVRPSCPFFLLPSLSPFLRFSPSPFSSNTSQIIEFLTEIIILIISFLRQDFLVHYSLEDSVSHAKGNSWRRYVGGLSQKHGERSANAHTFTLPLLLSQLLSYYLRKASKGWP